MMHMMLKVYDWETAPEEPKQAALEKVRERQVNSFVEFESYEFIKSANEFAKKVYGRIVDYSLYCDYSSSYMQLDLPDLSDEDRQAIVDYLLESAQEEADGKCGLTGTYTDCYFYDMFADRPDPEHVKVVPTLDTVEQLVKDTVQQSAERFCTEWSENIMTDASLIEYASGMDFLVREDGDIVERDDVTDTDPAGDTFTQLKQVLEHIEAGNADSTLLAAKALKLLEEL